MMNPGALRAGQSLISPLWHMYGTTMNEARIAIHGPILRSLVKSALINERVIAPETVTAAS